MSNFCQVADKEIFNSIGPIESLYPDLAQHTVSNATVGEQDPQSGISTRVLYWYHPDYVGNVDLVTDLNQEAYEFYLYNPWGESLYHWESGSSSWNSPFRFNSKEFDAETGMHYYGARYHHPKLSVWMSVDPLVHKTLESYQYTGNNPIMMIDPNGLTDFINSATGEVATINDGMNQTVEVTSENWTTVMDFKKNEDGNNPTNDYNSFITDNGGVAVPTADNGGFIKDKEMFLGFMAFKAGNEEKEVAAWEVASDEKSGFVVQPWVSNTKTESDNDPENVEKYGFENQDIQSQYHTHPTNGLIRGLSEADAKYASKNQIPVHAVYSDGSVYRYIPRKDGLWLKPVIKGVYGERIR